MLGLQPNLPAQISGFQTASTSSQRPSETAHPTANLTPSPAPKRGGGLERGWRFAEPLGCRFANITQATTAPTLTLPRKRREGTGFRQPLSRGVMGCIWFYDSPTPAAAPTMGLFCQIAFRQPESLKPKHQKQSRHHHWRIQRHRRGHCLQARQRGRENRTRRAVKRSSKRLPTKSRPTAARRCTALLT